MTFEVQQTRWDRIIRRVSGSIGPGSRISETLSELFPVMDVERVPGELLLLGGTQICFGEVNDAGDVAVISQGMLRNPGESGNIVTVTQVSHWSDQPQPAGIGLTLNTLSNAGTQTIRDGRRGPAGEPVARPLHENLLVPGPIFFTYRLNGIDTFVIKDENAVAVLPPATALSVTNTASDSEILVGFMWRERPAEESELSLE